MVAMSAATVMREGFSRGTTCDNGAEVLCREVCPSWAVAGMRRG
jgi:hypothetical protein